MNARITLAALAAAALLTSGCAQMNAFQNGIADSTKSRLVGTWQGNLKCRTERGQAKQDVIVTFKPDVMPFQVVGNVFSLVEYQPGQHELVVASAVGGASLNDGVYFKETEITQNPGNRWSPFEWNGKITAPDSMLVETCGAKLTLKRISQEYDPEAYKLYKNAHITR